MTEIERIHSTVENVETSGCLLADFHASANNSSAIVLARTKEALSLAVAQRYTWPSVSEWKKILPAWFVNACSDEITRDEAERRLSLTVLEREKLAEKWSVGVWVRWFKPHERQWYWWDAKLTSPNRLNIRVQVSGFPFPAGSLKWLLIAAGADMVEIDNA